jgi:hypothetical protein
MNVIRRARARPLGEKNRGEEALKPFFMAGASRVWDMFVALFSIT